MDSPLDIARYGPVAVLTLNRPEKLNALNRALIGSLTRAVRELSADDTVRSLILTGAGRAFSAGVDLGELAGSGDVSTGLDWTGEDNLLNVMRACPHPLIVAINGFAVTGGLELALMGDMLIASTEARFADTHARVGITPSWGMTQVLPRLVGLNRARQMSLTGGFVDAATALDWGLVNEVVSPDALMPRARELAAQIAETDVATMRTIRGLIADSAELPLSEGLAREEAQFAKHIKGVSPDAVGAAMERVTRRGQSLTRKETDE